MSPKQINRPLDVYVRVSDVRGRSGESFISPQEQEDRCRMAAQSRGLQVGQVLTDLDVSGGKMDRPALNEALERIRQGVSGGIVVARIDRFGRTVARALDTIEDIDKAGGVVITAEGDFDTSTAVGELVLGMMLNLAQFELRRIRENWAAAKRRAVERGIHIAPRVPQGYVRRDDGRLEPNGRSAETIRQAYEMAAQGATYSQIAAFLNERKLPLWGGDGFWQPNRIKRLLANRVYLGEARSGSGHVNPDAHEPLTSPATWQLAQRNSKRGASSSDAKVLLAGLCRCASCRFAMKSQAQRGNSVAIYRCSTTSVHGRCEAPSSISMERLDDYILEQFLARADIAVEQASDESPEAIDAVGAAVEAERDYRAALTNTEMRKTIGAGDHDQMVAALHQAWQDALARIPQPTGAVGRSSATMAELVKELRESGDNDSLRELLGSAIEAIFVRPAATRSRNADVGDRIKIVWRGEEDLELPKRGTRFEPHPYVW